MLSRYSLYDTMNASEYKKFHESFMENNTGSSALHTFACIFITVQCTIYCSIGGPRTELFQYISEYVLIVLPLIAVHTVLADYIYMLNLIMFTLLLYEFVQYFPVLQVSKVFRQPNQLRTKHVQSISCLRGLTYLITVFCILAVDFQAFPRHLAKTEQYGYSLMDTGVGLFVLMSGLVHKDLRKENIRAFMRSNTKFVSILFFLGILRFVSVKQLDYQEHVTEYGVHWNFFYTLAVCKLCSTILLFVWNKPLLCCVSTLVLHEVMLYLGLQNWIFSNALRIDYLSANREGICSCLGYTSLYLFGVFFKNMLKDKSVTRKQICEKLAVGSVILWVLAVLVNVYRPISRTLANSAYCIYLEAILMTIMTVMYFFELLFQDRDLHFAVPLVLSAVNSNGLVYFLVANLMTGAINLSIRTLFISSGMTFIILNTYMKITLAFAVFLQRKRFRL